MVGDLYVPHKRRAHPDAFIKPSFGALNVVGVELQSDVSPPDLTNEGDRRVDALKQAWAVVETVERFDQDRRALPGREIGGPADVFNGDPELFITGLTGLLPSDQGVQLMATETGCDLKGERRVTAELVSTLKVPEHASITIGKCSSEEVQQH